MVKIDGFPAIIMHRTRQRGLGERQDMIAQVPLKGGPAAIESLIGKYSIELCRFKTLGQTVVAVAGMAKLDLPASIGQFFGDHLMPA